MSLTSNNNQKGKGANKNGKASAQNSKFISKPSAKATGFSKKPVKTGGTRGS